MAAYAGKGGTVVIGASGTLNELVSWQLSEKGDQVDVTAMSSSAGPREFLTTLSEWDGQVVMNYDPADADGQELLVANYSASIKVYPQGSGSGLKYWSGTMFVSSAQRQAAVDGKIQLTVGFKGTGTLTRATTG